MAFDVERIRKSTRRATKFVKRNTKRPTSDAVHKFRTSLRQLESALVALEVDSKPLLRELDKTRRLAGKIRDMDVLTANALSLDGRGELDCVVRLLEHLGAERAKRVRKLRVAISKRRHLTRSLERGLERIERAAGKRSAAARKSVGHSLELSSKLSRPGRLSRKSLHEYRSQVKELWDVLRLSDRAADIALVGKLGEVKDAIGDWHDWVELTDIAVDALDHRPSCALSKRIAGTRESKYRHALVLSQRLIARLRPKRRKSAGMKVPVASPILDAVAAIAQEESPEIAH